MKRLVSLLIISIFSLTLARGASALSSDFGGKPLSNNELANIRGGYLTAGGLLIEFGFNSRTLIDGAVQREIEFGTAPGQQNVDPSQLKQIIQVGENNLSIPKEVFDNLPAVVTIIQNSEDNKVIQNINTLDIRVSNTQVFQDRNLGSNVVNSTINSLK